MTWLRRVLSFLRSLADPNDATARQIDKNRSEALGRDPWSGQDMSAGGGGLV